MTRTKRRNRRWMRIAIPYAVVLTALLVSVLAYAIERPDPTDGSYLSPTSGADLGASDLASSLRQRGISIVRVTQTSEALVKADQATEPMTVFIPAPALVHPFYLRMIKLLPATTTIVLVAPTDDALAFGYIDAQVTGTRLSAGTASAAGCSYSPATIAGTAAVRQSQYELTAAMDGEVCYDGGLAVLTKGSARVVLVGADDPFRNDRIAEHDNRALAVGLLSTTPTMIWVDLHQAEERPGFIDDPALAGEPAAPPSLGSGSPDPDFDIPTVAPEETDQPQDQAEEAEEAANPLWRAFPPWVFAAVAMVALASALLALARGRRLGGPVVEPLPIVVRASETVEGRGRLYRRARARDVALASLRDRARHRLIRLLDLPGTAEPDQVVSAVCQASGWPAEQVTALLYQGAAGDDDTLVSMAAALERLVSDTTHEGHEGDSR